ncbi:hypothetical protein [Catenuloplanes japonicus]|uniref:hypothetical protein n=1 Tax=Catenuloplanes japonicus TaxID=33876 RepID=UPI000B17C9C2|nr:hypothetical protein [Catenuloplanes japonicus]
MISLEAVAVRAVGIADHAGAAAVLKARRSVYESAERLRELVVGADQGAVPVFRHTAVELRAVMTAGLQGAPEDVNRVLRAVIATGRGHGSRRWLPVRTGDGVAGKLLAASSALRTAGDVLASHLEPTGQARSQAGAAVRRGAMAGGLGDLASVMAASCRVDQQLQRVLDQPGGVGSRLRETHVGDYESIAALSGRSVEWWLEWAAGRTQPSVLQHLRVAVPGDVSAREVVGIRDVFVVVQSVSAQMFQRPEQITMVDVADACVLGSRLASLGAAVGRTAPEGAVADTDVTAALWREAARLAGGLGAHPDVAYPMRPAVTAAAKLLRDLAGQTIQGRRAAQVHQAAQSLPDLAAGVSFAVERGIEQHRLLTPTYVLTGTSSRLAHRVRPVWKVMTKLEGPAETLVDRLHTLATPQRGHDDAPEQASSVTAIAGQLDNVRSDGAANSTRVRGHASPLPAASPDRSSRRGR